MLQLKSNFFKVSQMFGDNVLGNGFILAIDHVHVKFPFAVFDKGSQLACIYRLIVILFLGYQLMQAIEEGTE